MTPTAPRLHDSSQAARPNDISQAARQLPGLQFWCSVNYKSLTSEVKTWIFTTSPVAGRAGVIVTQCGAWRGAVASAAALQAAMAPCQGCGAPSPTSACIACGAAWCPPGPSSCGAIPDVHWVEHPVAQAALLCPDCAFSTTRQASKQGGTTDSLAGRQRSEAAVLMDCLTAKPAPYPSYSAVLAPVA